MNDRHVLLVSLFAATLAALPTPALAKPKRASDDIADLALGALGEEGSADVAPALPAEKRVDVARAPEPEPEPEPEPAQQEGPRRVVVAEFDSPEKAWARPSVLAILAAQPDVEVIGWQDVAIVARRLGADPTSAAGRRTLSGEMRIFAWVDGTVGSDLKAKLWMTGAQGEKLAWLDVWAANGSALNGYVEAKLWQAFGPYLSDAEREKQRLEVQKALGQRKQEGRASELARQREIAAHRTATIAARIGALQKLGTERAREREALLAHQRKLAADRRAEEERKQREAEAEFQRKMAEQRRQQWMASAQPPPPAPAYAQPTYAQPTYAQPTYAQPTYAQPTYAQPSYAQPTYAQPTYAQPTAPSSAFADDGMTPEFRAWAEQRKAALAAERAASP